MESDWTQTVFAQDVAEVSAYIIWINKIPHIVYTDVLQIFFTIASTALLALLFLTGFRCNQCGFNLRYQRQCAEAGIVLCPFFGYIYRLSVHIDTLECVRNSDSFIYKVNGRPLQPHHFAAAQTIIGSQKNRQFHFCSGKYRKHLHQLICGVVACYEVILFWPFDIRGWVMRNQLQPYCINQRFVDVGMVMCNRISADIACVLFMGIEHFYVQHIDFVQLGSPL